MSVPSLERKSKAAPNPTEVPTAARSGLLAGSILPRPASADVLGIRVDATSYTDATERIITWALARESRTVAVATVNNVMLAHGDPRFRSAMRRADLVTPDGMPLVWALRLLGAKRSGRVAGPDLTPAILQRAAADGIPVGFYGGAPHVLERLSTWAEHRFPGLKVAFASSPPFRPLTEAEASRAEDEIVESGARIVFVGLGCPKQELWMDDVRGRIQCVTVGVGAAFDFLTGTKRRAPRILQRLGLEWCFRLACEPRRLWRRYASQNPRFVALFAAQLFRDRYSASATRSGTTEEEERT
jgi:N-acetylglucosaminyldiphosphoundecaprenol N-acetyl-beta-D-mannosaminyltransferase